jgi:hypothetical protein
VLPAPAPPQNVGAAWHFATEASVDELAVNGVPVSRAIVGRTVSSSSSRTSRSGDAGRGGRLASGTTVPSFSSNAIR